MSRDSVAPLCPLRAGRFISSPLESKDRAGFKPMEGDGEGLLQPVLPFFPVCRLLSLRHAG